VLGLRKHFYPPLAEIANGGRSVSTRTSDSPRRSRSFLNLPPETADAADAADYNCLHQDVYGEIAFPLQAACVLGQHGRHYTGGELLLTEQRPRMQTRGEAITIERREFVIFANRWRPVAGTRGDYRVNIRHRVSRLKSGELYCLGLIFHNAK
jgi:uncharacterized protein